jgi:hypothetical protein
MCRYNLERGGTWHIPFKNNTTVVQIKYVSRAITCCTEGMILIRQLPPKEVPTDITALYLLQV